jgi:hypothetical protein
MERNSMTPDQIGQARDKDLPSSLIALRRAARAAREMAVRTDTAIVIWRDGQVVRITADDLRKAGIK